MNYDEYGFPIFDDDYEDDLVKVEEKKPEPKPEPEKPKKKQSNLLF